MSTVNCYFFKHLLHVRIYTKSAVKKVDISPKKSIKNIIVQHVAIAYLNSYNDRFGLICVFKRKNNFQSCSRELWQRYEAILNLYVHYLIQVDLLLKQCQRMSSLP